jgi:NADH-quinone oxidoreductase subunit H
MNLPLVLLLLNSNNVYQLRDVASLWEAFRAWMNTEPLPGWRFTHGSANGIMLVSTLVFIFLLELLITIGLQVWERRLMGRMQSRRGPQEYGGASAAAYQRLLWPVLGLLALPAGLYGLEYWTDRFTGGHGVYLGPNFIPNLTFICTGIAFVLYLVHMFRSYWRQGLYDTIKIFFKEDVMPLNADRLLYLLAPVLVYLPALLSWVVIPFGTAWVGGHIVYYTVQDLNVGLLLVIADFALFLVAVIMAGYASNNKYALVGAMREAAMLLTYEVPMLMALLCVAVFAGSLNLTEIVERQTYTWGILPLFPAFVIYLVVALAETNRPPFDLPEAQNELLGGYLVEYSGVRFALYYVAEYSNVFIVSAIMTVCFLGGWKGPMFLGLDGLWLSSLCWFLLKTYLLVAFFIWARATMPRIRIDQIMFFSWKFLLPASTLVLIITALGVMYRHPWFSANHVWARTPQGTLDYLMLSTPQVYALLDAHEKIFFWVYNFLAVVVAALVLWFAWGVLGPRRRQHPQPRREVTWT